MMKPGHLLRCFRSQLDFLVHSVTGNDDWTQSDINLYHRTINGTDIVMVLVPAGTFLMGNDPVGEPANGGEQRFDTPFYISRTEITNAEFDQLGCTVVDPDKSENSTDLSFPQRPRVSVTWFEARDCAAKMGMRLPTEAEWEYAARGPE